MNDKNRPGGQDRDGNQRKEVTNDANFEMRPWCVVRQRKAV